MLKLLESKKPARWTPESLAIYKRFPAAIRSKAWPDIVALAAAGQIDDAAALAQRSEDRIPRIRAENVVARRLRTLRLKLFSAQVATDAAIKKLFTDEADRLQARLGSVGNTPAGIKRATDLAHQALIRVRLLAGPLLRDAIWDAAKMGLKSPGEAFGPIFADNVESFSGEIAEQVILESVIAINEDRLTFGLSKRVASRDPNAKQSSPKWSGALDRIYTNIVKRNNAGLTLSQRVFDLTDQTERALKRMLAREIAAGTAPRDVAAKAGKYLRDEVAAGEAMGAGVYRNPPANLMRLARTETNRAYINANTAWARGKTWLQHVTPTLSKIHDLPDVCDDRAGDPMTPDEFDALYPLHPHCMCYPTFVIKDEYLTAYDDTPSPGGTD